MDHKNSDLEKLFAPVLEWLDQGAPHVGDRGFNMQFFESHPEDAVDYAGHECGTAMCIAGAIKQFNPAAFSADRDLESISRALGPWASRMFYGENFVAGDWSFKSVALDKITPKMAADTIRGFLATGNVIWEGAE